MGGHNASRAVDGDMGTRWATDSGTHAAWLEVDLGAPTAFSRVTISEWIEFSPRVRKFELQYKDGDAWKTILEGAQIGDEFTKDFAPVTARYVRLNILDAADGPTLWEFQLVKP